MLNGVFYKRLNQEFGQRIIFQFYRAFNFKMKTVREAESLNEHVFVDIIQLAFQRQNAVAFVERDFEHVGKGFCHLSNIIHIMQHGHEV